ncbi:MAG: ATP-binding protein [Sphaerospermopsis kisseleviana]
MTLDITRLFELFNASGFLDLSKPEDREYYIDFSSVRGNIINEIKRTIIHGGNQTCQLFTGHIGCGKSTELSRLKLELEQENFYVVYFQSTQELDIGDVDISDLLMVISRQVSLSLEEANINLDPSDYRKLLQDTYTLLNSRVTGLKLNIPAIGKVGIESKQDQYSLSLAIAEITTRVKNSSTIRQISRSYLEPQVQTILKAINEEVIEPAKQELKKRGKEGLVIIVDALEKMDNREKLPNCSQAEYLFIERGEQLKNFNCHVIYTIPPILAFSNKQEKMRNRFGIETKMLPMVRVKERDGNPCMKGIELLRKMILARAFPDIELEKASEHISEIFDSSETLDFVCQISGGHIRNLISDIFTCLQKKDPPFSPDLISRIISQRQSELSIALKPEEWDLLRQVAQNKTIRGEDKYQNLLSTLYIFEYRDDEGQWFDINPYLADAKELRDG